MANSGVVGPQVRAESPEAAGAPRAEEPLGRRGPRRRRPRPEAQGPAAVQSETAGRAVQHGGAEEEPDGGSPALPAPPLQRAVPPAATSATFIPERRRCGAAGPPPRKAAGLSERLARFMWPQPHVVKPVPSGRGLAV